MSLSFKAFSMYNLVALAWNMPRPLGEELIKENGTRGHPFKVRSSKKHTSPLQK